MKSKKMLCAVVALALVVPAVAAAQEGGGVVWLSMLQAKPGQSQALIQTMVEQNTELYDSLMEQGAILQWGIAQPITHTPDQDYSHVEFVIFPNWEGVNTFVSSFLAAMGTKSAEERAAEQAAFDSVREPGSHYDIVNRTAHFGGTPLERPSYLNLAYFKVKPDADFMGLYKEFAVPVFQQVSEAGDIGMFGVDVQEIHGDHSWTHMAWYSMPGLGARDTVDAAFDAAEAARSEEENKAMQARFAETFVPGHHRDEIAVVVHWNGGSGGDGGDGE